MEIRATSTEPELSAGLLEQVLERLGFSEKPDSDLTGLTQVYSAWCQRVPFDNARKMIHVAAHNTAALPGDTADDFFRQWIKHGTGGTCWSGNGALCTLLSSIGFAAARGIATMTVAPDIPPNHGTVLVEVSDSIYWLDASILHLTPLLLDDKSPNPREFPFNTQLRYFENKWFIWWLPLHRLQGLDCRLESYPASQADFQSFHEQTRNWSPFNYELAVRKISGNKTIGIGANNFVELDIDGTSSIRPIQNEHERIELLIENLGFSEEIARQFL